MIRKGLESGGLGPRAGPKSGLLTAENGGKLGSGTWHEARQEACMSGVCLSKQWVENKIESE
jgi:hypothetical protein